MASNLKLSESKLARVKNKGLILYDGDCGFCNFWVLFILKNDPKEYFLFAKLQEQIFIENNKEINPSNFDSVLLLKNGILYDKSTAVLQISKNLKWPWKLALVFSIMPKIIRNCIYDFIARNRTVISKKMSCRLPTKDELKRFI